MTLAMTALAVQQSPATAAALPHACAVLSSVHPQKSIGPAHAIAGMFSPQSSTGFSGCHVKIGAITIYMGLSTSGGSGGGGYTLISKTHPGGLGPLAELVVGKLPGGGPVDYLRFQRAGIYASISANGTVPSRLVVLARQVYAKL